MNDVLCNSFVMPNKKNKKKQSYIYIIYFYPFHKFINTFLTCLNLFNCFFLISHKRKASSLGNSKSSFLVHLSLKGHLIVAIIDDIGQLSIA